MSKGPSYRIVGFDVLPHSIDSMKPGENNECILPDSDNRLEITKETKSITFSYSVNWEASTVRWASRWDAYLNMGDVQLRVFDCFLQYFFLIKVLLTKILK